MSSGDLTRDGRFGTEEGHMQKAEFDLPDADSFNGFCAKLWGINGVYVAADSTNPLKMKLVYHSANDEAVGNAIREQMPIECQRIKDAADPMKKLQTAT